MRTLNEHLSEETRTSLLRYDPANRPEISTVFPADGPLEVEIGCGKGKFLIARAAENPWINFLGIDMVWKWMRYAVHRSDRRQIRNVKFIRTEAKDFIVHSLPAEGVSTFHVYFPDPWWKKKHRRRRVFTDEFVDLAARVLEPEGLLYSRTDVGEYFEVISSLMNHDPRFEEIPVTEENELNDELDYRTSFERKAHKAGTDVSRGLWRLKNSPE